ncbi:PLP-dependent aminotransferase family protein [Streptomyces sp. 8K308]|uniref:aminotransferase-like domain-containing protein n=1 Tax=Streptomyces sp. 8K308 TaxID=2530388 RepID=UPI0010472F37|nr:PLP-dependent aminotransferase family protein [Streptomyces sp. 8K308]TDC26253.1 PLP-dependent aminotransferase family protein [Streptomyces sp. 8K308]
MALTPADLADRLGRWSSGRGPLYLLLAARLRRLVDEGELPPGAALPPDRALAGALAVGRGTVVAAYEQLRVEGRIVRRQGSGTRVAGPARPGPRETTGAPVFLHLLEPSDDVIQLACAAPTAPPSALLAAYERALPRLATVTDDIGYRPAGHPRLRHAVAAYYARRGLPTEAEQIVITNGGQQALSLLARAFVEPGGRVLVEAPTYPGALEAFGEQAAHLRALPVGLDGFESAVAAPARRPDLAYLVSTHHNPTGAVLPPLVRRRLARAAAAADVPLVDDEVLAHLTFPGHETPPPLAAYAESGVVTVGSLSKSVWGGLRVGWIRAARPVADRLARLRAVHDLGGNLPAQLAAAELLPGFEGLCAELAAERRVRHDHLRAELARLLPEWEVPPAMGGQTLWVRLPHGDGDTFAQAALRHGVAVVPGAGLDASGGSRQHVRLHSFAPTETLTEAARRLATAWGAYGGDHDAGQSPRAMAV